MVRSDAFESLMRISWVRKSMARDLGKNISARIIQTILGKSQWVKKMKVIMYHPIMRSRVADEADSDAQQYVNCFVASYKPCRENYSWIDMKLTIFCGKMSLYKLKLENNS